MGVIPADEVDEGGRDRTQQEALPRSLRDEKNDRGVQGEEVREEKDSVVAIGAQQRRRGEAADERIGSEKLGVLQPGHGRVPGRNRDHQKQRERRGQQVEQMKGRP